MTFQFIWLSALFSCLIRRFSRDERGVAALDMSLAIALLIGSSAVLLEQGYAKERDENLRAEGEQGRYAYQLLSNFVLGTKDNLEIVLAAGPRSYTIAELQASGFAPANFNNTTFFGKSYHTAIARTGPLQFKYIVFGTGGAALSDSDLGQIARAMGTFGGAVYAKANSVFTVNSNFISEDLSDFVGAADVPAVGDYGMIGEFNIAETVPDYISRSRTVSGANQMNVDFDAGGNSVMGASELRTSGVVAGSGLIDSSIIAARGLGDSHPSGTAALAATPSTLGLRDEGGRLKVEAPVDDDDAANKGFVLAQAGGGGGNWHPGGTNVGGSWAAGSGGTSRTYNNGDSVPGVKVWNCSFHSYDVGSTHSIGYAKYVSVTVRVAGAGISTYLVSNLVLLTVRPNNSGAMSRQNYSFANLETPDGAFLQVTFTGNWANGLSNGNGLAATYNCNYNII